MKSLAKAKFASLCRYDFFARSGQPYTAEGVARVANWTAALRESKSQKWKNCRLAARNVLFEKVQISSWERGQDWGPLSDELRPMVVSHASDVASRIPNGLRERLRDTLAWDFMLICFEEEYQDLVQPFFYIPHLDPWYRKGHFPCGWEGEEFPEHWDGAIREGKLMVY